MLDVSLKTDTLRESIDDLDRCRIRWGEVKQARGDLMTVEYRPLVIREGQQALGEPAQREVVYQVDGRSYLKTPAPGDVVSLTGTGSETS